VSVGSATLITISVDADDRTIVVPYDSRVLEVTSVIRPGELKTKDPDDALFYQFDWTEFLNGEATIASSTWTVTEPNADTELDITNESVLSGDLVAQALVSGGTLGLVYRVHNEITLSGSPTQRAERSFKLRIQQR
jgi:hypothetical protein